MKKIVGGRRFKRVNGYNLFFSHYVRKNSEISPGMANRSLYIQCLLLDKNLEQDFCPIFAVIIFFHVLG